MNIAQIKKAQREYGYSEMQDMINTGTAWKMEGSIGREAMHCLESGACMLPLVPRYDYYGNKVPSRKELQQGTKGTFGNCKRFWEGVNDGSIYLDYNDETL